MGQEGNANETNFINHYLLNYFLKFAINYWTVLYKNANVVILMIIQRNSTIKHTHPYTHTHHTHIHTYTRTATF